MHNLKRLGLKYNGIGQLTKKMFCNLTNLTYLDLSHNKLNQLDGDVFSHLGNLEKLNISHNRDLQELKPQTFVGLDKLIELDISCLNSDFKLDLDLFQALPSLNTIHLGKNLKKMNSELLQKYGSNITFTFD